MHTITGLEGVAVVMLLWLLIGSRAKVEDLCGYLTHSHILGNSALATNYTNDYTKSLYIDSVMYDKYVGEAMLKISYDGSLLPKQYNTSLLKDG